jgi:Cu/Ag efflux protein CusF
MFAAVALFVVLPLVAQAQKPVTQTEAVEVTATIEAIDHSTRAITLKHKDGRVETIYAPPEVKRFHELKVGDTVTFRYYESVAYQIRKAGEPGATPAVGGEPKIVRSQGERPGAAISQQQTTTVTIKAIDANVPSVTVLTADGRSVSMKVQDKNNLKDLKVGDKVDVTYTEAVLITVK